MFYYQCSIDVIFGNLFTKQIHQAKKMVVPKSVPRYTFNDGNTVPFVGLGTWQSQPDGSVYRAVRHALASGYRHLDCAFIYQNQDEIGRAITDSIKEGVVSAITYYQIHIYS